MAILNKTYCDGSNKNTGTSSCPIVPKNITGIIIAPLSTAYTATDILAFWSTLEAGTINDDKAARIYPVGKFTGIETNDTEPQIETDNYGGKEFVRDGDYDWKFMFKNGHQFYKRLRTFNNKQNVYGVYLIDESNNAYYGWVDSDGRLRPYTLEMLLIPNFKINTGSESTKYYIQIAFKNSYELNDMFGHVILDSPYHVNNLVGLKDIELTVSTALNGTGTVEFNVTSDGADLTSIYTTELATAGLYTAVNSTTGAAITVTSVAVNATTQKLTVDLDSSDTDYPSSGGKLKIKIGAVSDLISAGIEGFAETEIELTV